MKAHALNVSICRSTFAFKVSKNFSQEILPKRFLNAFVVSNSRLRNKMFRDECKFGLCVVRNFAEKCVL